MVHISEFSELSASSGFFCGNDVLLDTSGGIDMGRKVKQLPCHEHQSSSLKISIDTKNSIYDQKTQQLPK